MSWMVVFTVFMVFYLAIVIDRDQSRVDKLEQRIECLRQAECVPFTPTPVR